VIGWQIVGLYACFRREAGDWLANCRVICLFFRRFTGNPVGICFVAMFCDGSEEKFFL